MTDLAATSTSLRVLIAVCTYNERENLPELVEGISCAIPDADILVVDDGSPDGTGEWASGYSTENPHLSVMQRSGKLGLGSAVVAAMRHAIGNDYDYFVNLDGDLSHDPASIPRLLAKSEESGADVVIGSRYVSGGSIKGWPPHRRFMSALLNRVARVGMRLGVTDCSGSFRCYRVSTLRGVDLDLVRAKGYAMLEEILCLLKMSKATFAEVPITFTDRERGASKLNLGEAIRSALTILKLSTLGPRRR